MEHDPMWSLVLLATGNRIAAVLQSRIPKAQWSLSHDISEDATQVRFTWHGIADSGQVLGRTTATDLPKTCSVKNQAALFDAALKAVYDSFAGLAASLAVVEIQAEDEAKETPLSDAVPSIEKPKECLCGAFTGDNDACPQHGLNTAWRDLWG